MWYLFEVKLKLQKAKPGKCFTLVLQPKILLTKLLCHWSQNGKVNVVSVANAMEKEKRQRKLFEMVTCMFYKRNGLMSDLTSWDCVLGRVEEFKVSVKLPKTH